MGGFVKDDNIFTLVQTHVIYNVILQEIHAWIQSGSYSDDDVDHHDDNYGEDDEGDDRFAKTRIASAPVPALLKSQESYR